MQEIRSPSGSLDRKSNQSVQFMLTNREQMVNASSVNRRTMRWLIFYNYMILIDKIVTAQPFWSSFEVWIRIAWEHLRDWKSANEKPISGWSERREIPPKARH
jgi:hypothetical protein